MSWYLGRNNLNNIKAVLGLCTTRQKCFIAAQSVFMLDVSGNLFSLPNFERLYAMEVSVFTPDTSNPYLISWDFDYNSGQLFLNFDETVYAQYLNESAVVLRSNPCTYPACYVIADGECNDAIDISDYDESVYRCEHVSLRLENPLQMPTENLATMSITVSDDQLNYLKNNPYIFTDASNSYVTIDPKIIVDTSYDQNAYLGTVSATQTEPMGVEALTPDTTSPVIRGFKLNLDSRILTVQMSEVIKISSVVLNALSLQSEQVVSARTQSFVLSAAVCELLTISNSVDIEIFFKEDGFNFLRSFQQLAQRPMYTFLSATDLFVIDTAMNENRVVAISEASAVSVSEFSPDLSRPHLKSWEIDMSYDRITLTFSEPMNTVQEFELNALTLQSDLVLVPSTISHSLVASYVREVIENIVIVQMSSVDANMVKSSQPLCTNPFKCFLVADEELGYDRPTFDANGIEYKNQFIAAESSASEEFIFDVVPPYLLSYQIDMNDGLLHMVFSEPVDLYNFASSGLTFYNELLSGGLKSFSVGLSDNTIISSVNLENITIEISRYDYMNLKKTPLVAESLETTYIGIDSSTCTDVAGNSIIELVQRSQQVNCLTNYCIQKPLKYTEDIEGPSVECVALQRIGEYPDTLYVYFDDVIDFNSVDIEDFYLFEDKTKSMKLSLGGILTSNTSDYFVEIDVSNVVLDSIGSSQRFTNFYISSAFSVRDIPNENGNEEAMNIQDGVREGNKIASFRLDLAQNIMTLEFIYPMRTKSLDISQFRLHTEDLQLQYTMSRFEMASLNKEETQYLVLPIDIIDSLAIQTYFPGIKKEVNCTYVLYPLTLTSFEAIVLFMFPREFDPVGSVYDV